MERRLGGFDALLSSNLAEAETLPALVREGFEPSGPDLFARLAWILPDRPLTEEMIRALGAGHLRGADLWHIACALYVPEEPGTLTFLTLDRNQKAVAARLGFAT